MDRLAHYDPQTGATTVIVRSAAYAIPPFEFKAIQIPLGSQGIQIPSKGFTTIRIASMAVDMKYTDTPGTVRVGVQNLPVPNEAVLMTDSDGVGVIMAYMPLEFEDIPVVTDPLSQPVIQLLNGVSIPDIVINIQFEPRVETANENVALNLNAVFVIETDGSREGSQILFTQ